ncbi:MAG: 4-(cytidine 5'-diphospho)-2-C-methyl-D-erythritol kinase [Clostridia bacterium]|nr:4-(cytidine 5'-diphospho)-2-C-methyl-D-erythritol kinase [Clostridia bacterium]
MASVRIKAHAKINLTLEILGVENGYHTLDSLVASLDLHDLIVLKKRKDKLSSVLMKGLGSESIPPEQNNALKAAEAFSEKFGVNGADITVYKNIPLGGGLGGSSADASGVIRGMAKLYGVKDETALEALAETLGSDTKYMLRGGFARMQGRGEKLTFLGVDEQLHFLMICPKSGVSAKACYQKYDELPRTLEWRESHTENCIRKLSEKDKNGVGRYLTNDLYVPALHLDNDVERAYTEAQSFSPLGTVMTGSGSCVLALFETKELCEWAKSRYKGKFTTEVVKTVLPSKQRKGIRNPWRLEE